MVEINLELNPPVPKYGQKVFKSPPIARLKSAPRKKGAGQGRNVKNFTKERITVKSTVKERNTLSPLPQRGNSNLSDKDKIRFKKIELKPKTADKINFPPVNKNISQISLTNSTRIKVVEKKVTKWEAGTKNHGPVCKTSTKTSTYEKYSPDTAKASSPEESITKPPSPGTSSSSVTTRTPDTYVPTESEDTPTIIDPSVFSSEELATLMTDLSITEDSECSNSQCEHLDDVSTALKLCEKTCKNPCKLICQYHCIRAIDCKGLCSDRCLNPTDDKVRQRVIALLGTKIKFPVTRSIIIQSKENDTKAKVNAKLELLNEKLNERLKEWNTREVARKVAESGEEEESVTESAANLRRGSVMDRAVRFTQTMAKQLTPHRRSMARITENANEESDIAGCRYLRCTSEAQELSFMDKCEKGIRNTIKRGSIMARRMSTMASNNIPMRITIRTIDRTDECSEGSSASSETDYDNISSIESSNSESSTSGEYAGAVRHPRMNRLVSMLPNSVVKKFRSQKWKTWIAKVKEGNDLHEMPEAPSED